MIDDLWYKNAVIYSLDLETFMDGNGDGVGDFVEFMQLARDRGLAALVDLVANHTSDQHPWFQRSHREPESRYRDWYVWSDTRPPTWNQGMVFPGVQKATWTRDPVAGRYYYHRFYEFQPSLNLDNPDVRGEIHRVIGYWLQLGVAGFRLDALPFLIEESPRRGNWRPTQNFDYLAEIRRFVQWRAGDAILVGEANVTPAEASRYFGGDHSGVRMMFNFHLNQRLFLSLREREAVRTPMQWSAERNGGFSRSAQSVLPSVVAGRYGVRSVNVERQWRDLDSHLNWVVRMIRLRRTCPEVGWGDWHALRTGSRHVLALAYTWRGSWIVTVHNLAGDSQRVRLALDVPDGDTLVDLIHEARSRAGRDGRHHFELEAFGYRWFRAGDLGCALERERDVPESDGGDAPTQGRRMRGGRRRG